ncbi:hypothetical protein TUMEXPCC7403_18925 [Tumidithrix helvetica PCC 7403]|uniref:CmcI family methyltransferase n=1 Tax=Tumidithrix helvetica TaxID=3457545 RepID=UPI003CB681EC
MLHFFLTGYAIREHSYSRYEFYNFELAKWAEYYLSQKVSFHQSNWCTGKVTENPQDILLGHPTWDNPEQAEASGIGQIKCDWVKDNALTPQAACHPNTYIIMPWVPEFPQEWVPNLVKVESQLLAVNKIFTLCGQVWFDRTLAKVDDSIQSRVRHKLIRSNIGVALQNFPFVKQQFNPIGKRQMLHVSTLGSYKGFDVTCESLKGLDVLLNVASQSLKAPQGMVDVRINDRQYSFNFLGGINNGDPNLNQWVVNTCDFYIHTATLDAQATAILENCARGLIPLVTPESGFDCPDAIFLTHDPDRNRQIIKWALNLPEAELLSRSQKIRDYLLREHNWETIFDKVWDGIQSDIEVRKHASSKSGLEASQPQYFDLQADLANRSQSNSLVEQIEQAIALLSDAKPLAALGIVEALLAKDATLQGIHYLKSLCLRASGQIPASLAAVETELALNPSHFYADEAIKTLRILADRQAYKSPTHERVWESKLTRDNMLPIELGAHLYSYKGIPMLKNPFDLALYPLLLWEVKPRSIIEIGSKYGGSALWMADLLDNFHIDGHIYSVDLIPVNLVRSDRVTFLGGDGRRLETVFSPEFLKALPRPLLVIEDADHTYETTSKVLEFFHPYLRQGEYILVEDGMTCEGALKASKEFLDTRGDAYEVDRNYCDFFGTNVTWNINGYLRKTKDAFPIETESISLDFLPLNDINLIVFPDWSASPDDIRESLSQAIRQVLLHSDRGAITLLIDASDTDVNSGDELLAELTMNLIMQEDIDLEEEPQIALISDLSPVEWQVLIGQINSRITTDLDDRERIQHTGAESLKTIASEQLLAVQFTE